MIYSMTGRGNKFVFADHCRRQLGTSGSRKLQVNQCQIYKKKTSKTYEITKHLKFQYRTSCILPTRSSSVIGIGYRLLSGRVTESYFPYQWRPIAHRSDHRSLTLFYLEWLSLLYII